MKKLTIGTKLMSSFGAILVVTLGLGLSSLNSINTLAGNFETAANKTMKKVFLIDAIINARSEMVASQRGVLQYTYAKLPAAGDKAAQAFDSAAQTWGTSLSELRPMLVTEEGKRLTTELESDLAAWRPIFIEIKQLAVAGKAEDGVKLAMEKALPVYESAGKAGTRLREIQQGLLEKDRLTSAEMNSTSKWLAIILIGLSLVIGAGILYVVRQITQTLRKASSELAEGAEQVSSASGEVSGSSQSLAQGASEQAASLEETSASSEEMSSMTRKNSENSQQAAVFMNGVSQRVAEANTTLADMMTSMQEISASSGKISKIIKVIDEIAFQTNILALNAAVEAARAGEAGMGFAVVADEVRNLAQRSAQAAKDTASLIEDSILKSAEGSKKLGDVAGSIQAITEGAGKVKVLVDEVEASSKEQAQGIEQISKAVAQMDEVTQRTAANAEESASASEELNAQAQALMSVVEQLQALVGGDSGRSAAPRKPVTTTRRPAPPSVQTSRRLQPTRKPAMAAIGARDKGDFPLDDKEFKEF